MLAGVIVQSVPCEPDLDRHAPQFSLACRRLELDVGFSLVRADRHVRRDIQFLTSCSVSMFGPRTSYPQSHEDVDPGACPGGTGGINVARVICRSITSSAALRCRR